MSSGRRDLWIKCPCGRRLAIVSWPARDAANALGSTTLPTVNDPKAFRIGGGMELRVDAAPGVPMRVFQRPQGRAYQRVESVTYTWQCRCGRSHTRKHEWIGRVWNATASLGKVATHRRVFDVTHDA